MNDRGLGAAMGAPPVYAEAKPLLSMHESFTPREGLLMAHLPSKP